MSFMPLLLELLEDEPSIALELANIHPEISNGALNSCSWPITSYLSSLAQQRHENYNQQIAKSPHTDEDGFQVSHDVKHFAPNEISVKTVDDNTIVVEGKHEEKEDEHGDKNFVRRYTLPKEYNVNDVASTLSSDGVLTIKAPPPENEINNKEMDIQIQQNEPVHLSVEENLPENPKEKSAEKVTE